MTPDLPGTRAQRRAARAVERRSLRTGGWAPWARQAVRGVGRGWCADIETVFSNGLYVVLVRRVLTQHGEVIHLAIRTPSSLEPPWRDLQRIKNELYGAGRIALQVYPPEARLIDEADMYHLWVMPEGWTPGFGLHRDDEGRGAKT